VGRQRGSIDSEFARSSPEAKRIQQSEHSPHKFWRVEKKELSSLPRHGGGSFDYYYNNSSSNEESPLDASSRRLAFRRAERARERGDGFLSDSGGEEGTTVGMRRSKTARLTAGRCKRLRLKVTWRRVNERFQAYKIRVEGEEASMVRALEAWADTCMLTSMDRMAEAPTRPHPLPHSPPLQPYTRVQ